MLDPDFVCDGRRLEGLDQSTWRVSESWPAMQCLQHTGIARLDVCFGFGQIGSVPFSDQTSTLLNGKEMRRRVRLLCVRAAGWVLKSRTVPGLAPALFLLLQAVLLSSRILARARLVYRYLVPRCAAAQRMNRVHT